MKQQSRARGMVWGRLLETFTDSLIGFESVGASGSPLPFVTAPSDVGIEVSHRPFPWIFLRDFVGRLIFTPVLKNLVQVAESIINLLGRMTFFRHRSHSFPEPLRAVRRALPKLDF